jgi:transposase InsO family protein
MRDCEERDAIFWCTLLQPVLFGELAKGELAAHLKEVASQEVCYPDGRRRKPSLSTLKRKLRLYRQGGFTALPRKARKDRGLSRAIQAEVLQTAVAAKREQPRRSARTLNLLLEARHHKTAARSTLYRHLKAAGATRLKLGVVKEPVRKRWTCEHTHDLWVGDFADGPCVLVRGESVRTHLSAFIDAHSRYVVAARYYLRETLDILCDTLIRALAVHGSPRGLYLDNAKVYHADSLKRMCWQLHIRLRHRPARDPAPGGLIERFIQTVQGQFESEARAGQILTLDKLNEAFQAWLEVGYHRQVHSEIAGTPQERHDQGMVGIRQADMQAVSEAFLQREKRTVDKTFSDVSLHHRLYRVDQRLRGDRVEVRFDPFGNHDKVWIHSLAGEYLGEGLLHTRQVGERPRIASPGGVQANLLDLLVEKQKRLHRQEDGVDFRNALTATAWPFGSFTACLAGLLGRTGGLTAFSAEELDALRQVHERQPALTRTRLKQAFLRASQKTIPVIVHALQTEN